MLVYISLTCKSVKLVFLFYREFSFSIVRLLCLMKCPIETSTCYLVHSLKFSAFCTYWVSLVLTIIAEKFALEELKFHLGATVLGAIYGARKSLGR